LNIWRNNLPAYAILGAQWGDEGKGKIVDFLSEKADVVARFAGGNNAGHTVINDQGHFSLHQIPSGIFWPQTLSVMGSGVVVDPPSLLEEISSLKSRGIDVEGRLVISERAHLIMPYHIELDQLSESAKGENAIGTTGRGIGPAYADKASRNGLRVSELLDLDALKLRLAETLDNANALITKVYGGEPMELEAVFNKCEEWSLSLSSYIGAAEEILHDRLSDNQIVVLEGAQGALLDLDHGTYPFVTSSNPTIGGASVGLGLHPSQISGVIGVFKAYCTRVGGGPFPTELTGETGERIRNLAQEFGTTTGRPRRVGWFDAIMANYSSKINGYTSVVLTRLDVLDGFDSIKICVGYELNGKRINRVPGGQGFLQHCEPVYEEYPGWDEPTAGATSFGQLPKKAVDYVMRLENLIGCPVDVISTGPKRHEAITRRSIL
jgi:adenylosuccinate synthase